MLDRIVAAMAAAMEVARDLVGVGPASPGYYWTGADALSEETDDMASETNRSAAAAASEEEFLRLLEPEAAAGRFILPDPAAEEAKARRAAPDSGRACNWLRLLINPPPLHPPPDFR